MIKKVSSWVLGSFFRQFGRFLFFLVLGGLVFLLIQHNDINFKWTDLLGIETIKADSYYKAWDTVWYDNENLTQQWSSGTTFVYKTFQATQYYNSNLSLYKNYSSNKINMDDIKGGHITIPFVLEIPLLNKQTGHVETTCTQWYENPNGTFTCTQTTATNTLYNDYYIPIQLELNVFARYTSGYIDVCEIDYSKNYISCPVINSTGLKFDGITYAIKVYADGQTSNYRFGLGLKINGWSVDGKNIQDAVESQTNQTIEYFNDTNTTTDVNIADSFFSDTNSTSESVLADIVSTPLTLLNNLSTGTFTDICATLNNKQICLPSGNIIWSRQHGGAGVHDRWFRGGSTEAFITFFNLVVGGFILYKCLISLFHSVHKMLDPAQTYVEVMKL